MYASRDDRAYAAGLLDGEGYIGIYKKDRKWHQLQISVGMYAGETIQWLADRWGGWAYPDPYTKMIPTWRITNDNAGAFLQSVLPFLQVKYEQAEIALAFLRDRIKSPGHTPSLEQLALREGYYLALKAAKRKRADWPEEAKR